MNDNMCLDLAEYLVQFYEEAGRDAQELAENIEITKNNYATVVTIKNGYRIDRKYSSALSEALNKAHTCYLDKKDNDSRRDYFYAIAAHAVWCAVQHCACKSLKSAVESAGKAVGYCAAAKSEGEFYEAMQSAQVCEMAFLRPFRKLDIL